MEIPYEVIFLSIMGYDIKWKTSTRICITIFLCNLGKRNHLIV